MAKAGGIRRFLRFSLRSLLLLTLAVAAWLGYEVRQARQVERALAGIHALGGNAECELSGWSVLRLCRVPGYGQRIVRIEIPGMAVEGTLNLVRDMPGPREVQVSYDGGYDPTPSWQRVTEFLAESIVRPKAIESKRSFDLDWLLDDKKWKSSVDRRRLARIRTSTVEAYPRATDHMSLRESDHFSRFRPIQYRILILPGGSLGEIFTREQSVTTTPGGEESWAILLVEGKCVSVKGFLTDTRRARQGVVFEDLDQDGLPEVGFDAGRKAWELSVFGSAEK